MGIFDWISGRAKTWLAEPRYVPAAYKDVADGASEWVMSQEYAYKKQKNIRFYMAARKAQDEEGEGWDILIISRNMKHVRADDEDAAVTTNLSVRVHDANDVVSMLRGFEENCKRLECIPIEGARQTYRKFANRYQLHFDVDGRTFNVAEDNRIVHDTFMNSETLRHVFNTPKSVPVNNWEEFYTQVVRARAGENGALLASDATQYAACEILLERARFLTSDRAGAVQRAFESDGVSTYGRMQAVKDLFSTAKGALIHDYGLDADVFGQITHITKASALVAVLRAGAKFYEEMVGNGAFDADNIKFMRELGRKCGEFYVRELGGTDDNAKSIADILMQGADPYGPELPLEKLLREYKANPDAFTVKRDNTPPNNGGFGGGHTVEWV